jgi:hypothetical protein
MSRRETRFERGDTRRSAEAEAHNKKIRKSKNTKGPRFGFRLAKFQNPFKVLFSFKPAPDATTFERKLEKS